jgi:hypothetical protein
MALYTPAAPDAAEAFKLCHPHSALWCLLHAKHLQCEKLARKKSRMAKNLIELDKQATLTENYFQTHLQADSPTLRCIHQRAMTPRDKPSAGLSLPCGKFVYFSDKEMAGVVYIPNGENKILQKRSTKKQRMKPRLLLLFLFFV